MTVVAATEGQVVEVGVGARHDDVGGTRSHAADGAGEDVESVHSDGSD